MTAKNDLQPLLDQIDRLDQEATDGPWDHTVEWAEIGSGSDSVIHGYGYAHCDGCDEEIEGVDARVALLPQDAEFIALARTALPQLAKTLQAVIKTLDDYPLPPKQYDPTGIAFAELSTLEQRLRKAITAAMEVE